MMAHVVTSKLFKTGGSVALRIPAGWLDPLVEVTLERNPHTGRITLSQRRHSSGEDFFSFLEGQPHLPDPGLLDISPRSEPPRDSTLNS